MPIRRWAQWLTACNVAVAVSACWVPAETGAKMRADILALQREAQRASKDLALQRARLEEQIDEVGGALADLRRAERGTDAEFGVKIDRLIRELQELRGTLELVEYRLSKLEGKVEGDGSLDERLEKLEGEIEDVATASSHRPTAGPKDKKELILLGRKLAKEGKIGDARGAFRDLIKHFPSAQGYTDEAYFRLGDLYLNEKKYRSALQEYIKVAEKFASGKFAAGALYKIGICSMSLGNLEDAQIFFTEVTKNHRKSTYAKDAGRKLTEIKKRLDKEKASKKPGKKKKK
ncbi:MAG: tetratricopeptide repeat protein [Myxococcota bacterium]